MKRMTEAQFMANLGTTPITDVMRSALRSVLVEGQSPSDAAKRWKVGRSGIYKAIRRMEELGYEDDHKRETVRTPVRKNYAGKLRYLIRCQLAAWEQGLGDVPIPEHMRVSVQTPLDGEPAPVIRPMDPREFDSWDEEK